MAKSKDFLIAVFVVSAITQIHSAPPIKIPILAGKKLKMEFVPEKTSQETFREIGVREPNSELIGMGVNAGIKSLDVLPGGSGNFPPEAVGPSQPKSRDVFPDDFKRISEISKGFHYSPRSISTKSKMKTTGTNFKVKGENIDDTVNQPNVNPLKTKESSDTTLIDLGVGEFSKTGDHPSRFHYLTAKSTTGLGKKLQSSSPSKDTVSETGREATNIHLNGRNLAQPEIGNSLLPSHLDLAPVSETGFFVVDMGHPMFFGRRSTSDASGHPIEEPYYPQSAEDANRVADNYRWVSRYEGVHRIIYEIPRRIESAPELANGNGGDQSNKKSSLDITKKIHQSD